MTQAERIKEIERQEGIEKEAERAAQTAHATQRILRAGCDHTLGDGRSAVENGPSCDSCTVCGWCNL